jgi:dihydrofolate reductase
MGQKLNRKIVLFAAITLDGKIAKSEQSGSDWTSKEDTEFFLSELDKCDLCVCGRNTFEAPRKKMVKRNRLVLSNKVSGLDRVDDNLTFINPLDEDLSKYISAHNYKRVAVLGGGGVYAFFLMEGMVTDIYLTLEPLVFGSGVDFLAGINNMSQMDISLKSLKKLNSKGTVLFHYKVNYK